MGFLIREKIETLSLSGKRVLEVGAGDSTWLLCFAGAYPAARLHGLDYSEPGCAALKARAEREKRDVQVHHGDMFSPPADLQAAFDVVLVFRVVEHFADLARPMAAKKSFLKEIGRLFTLIPNMAGVMGWAFNKAAPEVYDIHNPHGFSSFLAGHDRAGLTVEAAGYLGSVNFGMLSSSAVRADRPMLKQAHPWLSRLSKAVRLLEKKTVNLPPSRLLSPDIYAISRKRNVS